MTEKAEPKLVQLKMRPTTIDKVNELKELLDLPSRTAAVKVAVDVADLLAEAVDKGSEIILVDKRGNKTKLIIPGLE